MSFERIDLNLLRVFEAVFQHRSVSMAARELAVTPSAVSHALGRLRNALGDELFVHGDDGMQPTARALELAPGIRDGLGRIEATILSRPFEPQTATRTFRIAASDYSTTQALVPFIRRLDRIAPQIELKVFPYNRLDVVRQIDEGRLDLVIGWFQDMPERMRRTRLLEDEEALVVRADHPLLARPARREEIFAYPFVVVELTGSEEQGTDGFMDDRGVWRRVWIDRLLVENSGPCDAGGPGAVSRPPYAAVADILMAMDMVATLPARIARRAVADGRLVLLPLPHEPLRVAIEAMWHQRSASDAGLQWLVREIVDAMSG